MSAVHDAGGRRLASRYVIASDEPLGSGSYATTWPGTDTQASTPVAIKRLNTKANLPVNANAENVRARFAREARIHSELRHEAIVPILDHGEDERGRMCIVMPYMAGGSLSDVLQASGDLAPERVRAIAARLLSALEYLHHQDLVHGDVSTNNVLLDADGIAYLADFGYSKEVAFVATSGDRHQTDYFREKERRYLPWEEIDDVYGVAAVLWSCLTGLPPGHPAEASLPPDAWREPLERALGRSRPRIRDVRALTQALAADATERWRARATADRRRWWHRTGAVVALAAAGLTAAGAAGQLGSRSPEQPEPARLTGARVAAILPSGWAPVRPQAVTGQRLTGAVAAAAGDTRIDAGVAAPVGPQLIAPAALRALPSGAREPREVGIGGRQALRFGPVAGTGGRASEIVALPLSEHVLVVSCSGPAKDLEQRCATAIATLGPRGERFGRVAADPAVAARLRGLIADLDETRRHERTRLAASRKATTRSGAARTLGRAYAAFATDLQEIDGGMRLTPVLADAAAAAQRLEGDYGRLREAVRSQPRWERTSELVRNDDADLRQALDGLADAGYAT